MDKELQKAISNDLKSNLSNEQRLAAEKSKDPFAFQKALRTFQLDVAETINRKQISVAKIAIAENLKQNNTESIGNPTQGITLSPQKSRSSFLKNSIVLFISLLLVGGGAYGAYFLYQKSPIAPVASVPQTPNQFPSIVAPASQQHIDAKSYTPSTFKTFINQGRTGKTLGQGQVEELVLLQKPDQRISVAQLLTLLGANPPQSFVRSLAPQYMIGYVQTQDRVPFVILKTNFFQSAFAGMLTWEKDMYSEVGSIFEKKQPVLTQTQPVTQSLVLNSTTTKKTATSSVVITKMPTSTIPNGTFLPVTSIPINNQKTSTSSVTRASTTPIFTDPKDPTIFKPIITYLDVVIKNKDVRELKRADGSIILLYSFIDKETLIITSSEASLSALITTLDNTIYTR